MGISSSDLRGSPGNGFACITIVLGCLYTCLDVSLLHEIQFKADWNLSNRVAPQNIYYDEHDLCTVAAGGHEKIVKPVRLGKRHGQIVIVNRQLCVANAFEQILEEKVPGLHQKTRHVYDTYGFPIARKIHSPYIADVVYLLMKPLEWMFYWCCTLWMSSRKTGSQYNICILPVRDFVSP